MGYAGVRARLATGVVAAAVIGSTSGCGDPESGNDSQTLRFGYMVSDTHPTAVNGLLPFADRVEDCSNGSVEIEMYPDAQLGGPEEALSAVRKGVMDLSLALSAYVPEELPLNQAWSLPFGMKGTEATRAMWQVLHQDNALAEELKQTGVVPLMTWTSPGYEFSSTDTPLDGIDSLKGLRLRSPSEVGGDIIGAAGGSDVFLASPETYEALDRGTVDGTYYYYAAWPDLSLEEVLHHSTDGLDVSGAGLIMVTIGQTIWDSLSDEQRSCLSQAGRDTTLQLAEALETADVKVRDELKAAGTLKTYEWSAEDKLEFSERMETVLTQWADEVGSAGQSAVEIIRAASDASDDSGELPEYESDTPEN